MTNSKIENFFYKLFQPDIGLGMIMLLFPVGGGLAAYTIVERALRTKGWRAQAAFSAGAIAAILHTVLWDISFSYLFCHKQVA